MNALTSQFGVMPDADTLGDMMRLSDMLAKSALIPDCYRDKPADVLVAILWGREVRLGPLQALQGIAIINGRAAIWGDAALALVRVHPAFVACREGVGGEGDARHGWCEVTRRGQPPERREFSVRDAKRAGLWDEREKVKRKGRNGTEYQGDNTAPWHCYPDRMLQMRARGFALRDVFADALRGVITVEEARDIPTEPRDVPNLAAEVSSTVIGPTAIISAGSLRLDALDTMLAGIDTAAEIRAYLDQPGQQAWMAGLRRSNPRQAAEADNLIAAHVARVDPSSCEGEPSVTTTSPTDWRALSWPVRSRDGTVRDMLDADTFEAEFAARIKHIEQHPKGSAADKARLIGAIYDCNRDVLAHLRERGHGATVECVEGLFAESSLMSAEVTA